MRRPICRRPSRSLAGLTLVLCRRRSAPRAQDSPLLAGDAGRDEAVDGRAPDEGRAGARTTSSTRSTIWRRCAPSHGSAAIVDDLADRSRTLQVQVRVGDYAFDSSRFVTQDRGAGVVPSLSELPASLDDNYDAIRRQIWLTTDAAYKRAVSVFAKKKATFQNRAATDALPDFSRRRRSRRCSRPARRCAVGQRSGSIARKQLSAVFASSPELDGVGSRGWSKRTARAIT